jgi:hypothetical protein
MNKLPIRRKDFDVQGFLAFVAQQGGEVGVPTNPYEVVRYRAYWRGTKTSAIHIVYAKENGLLTWTGGSEGHYRAFVAGTPMEELPGHIEGPAASHAEQRLPKSKSKSKAPTRAALRARDGDHCWFCGNPMGEDCTIEHLVPKAKGGRNSLANYALAHEKCNRAAADMPLVAKIALRVRLHAQVGTHPQGGDAKQAPGDSQSDAVPEGDAPNPSGGQP